MRSETSLGGLRLYSGWIVDRRQGKITSFGESHSLRLTLLFVRGALPRSVLHDPVVQDHALLVVTDAHAVAAPDDGVADFQVEEFLPGVRVSVCVL